MSFVSIRLRRIKFWWHLVNAYFKRYRVRVLIFLIAASTLTLGIIKIWPSISTNNLVTIGYIGIYDIKSIPSEILSLATQPLITTNAQGKPTATLASHWTVSQDGKTYVVFLKDNLKWHDSTSVDAKDITIAISDVQITSLNNKAIEFKLPNPNASFWQALDRPVFKSNSFFGTGNFRIVSIDEVESIVKKISLHPKDPKLPRVEIKFYPTEQQALAAFKMGEVKMLKSANAGDFSSWPNIELKKETDNRALVTVFYNNADEMLSSRDLRQALSFAINREKFDGVQANSPISQTSWAHNGSVKRYDYNIGKAKELVAKTNAKNRTFTLSVMPGLEEVAKQIKDNWEALGVKVEIKNEKSIPKEFQALLAVNHLSPDPDQYPLWHSTQKSTNITHYVNVKIDKLLEDARTTQSENDRKSLYADFQRFLVEDAPATFLYSPYTYHLIYRNIQPLHSKLQF